MSDTAGDGQERVLRKGRHRFLGHVDCHWSVQRDNNSAVNERQDGRWWAHLVARRPKLSRRSAFALRASVDSLRGQESEGWAHFEFTRINIEPIIRRKKIEDVREARTSDVHRRRTRNS
jgi:hypothetical protein